MNTEEIYNRYERSLMHIGAASDAVRMALRLAIEETNTAVKRDYSAHLDRLDTWLAHSGQRMNGYGVVDSAINTLTTLDERNASQADMLTSLRIELSNANTAASGAQRQLEQIDTWLKQGGYGGDNETVQAVAINTIAYLEGEIVRLREKCDAGFMLHERMTKLASENDRLTKEADELRQQLMQLDADNAELLHEIQKAGVTAPGKVSVEAVAKKLEGGN